MPMTPQKRLPSSSGTLVQPSSSKEQQFVDVAKALLDTAKETSDAFTPLKSCLGGINALHKHYDEYANAKDKLNDRVPRLKKLQETLARVNPDDDSEEIERRSHLARSLEDILTRRLDLSKKKKLVRVIDKARNSGDAAKLVKRLRQTLLREFHDAPLDVVEQRDPKGLYKKARAGETKEFTGASAPYKAPPKPEIHPKTNELDITQSEAVIVEYLTSKGIV